MDKNAIKKYAIRARRDLIAGVTQRAAFYGITPEDAGDPRAELVLGRALNPVEVRQRAALIARIRTEGYESVVEGIAYTWFNRFAALRFMEVNGYLPSRVRVFTDEQGAFRPQIMDEALDLDLDGLDQKKIYALKRAGDDEGLYKYLIILQCNALSAILPQMFQRIEDATELLFPGPLLRESSIACALVTEIPEEDWRDQVQIIGWLYQYYNSEPKDAVFAALKKNIKVTKETLPAATQLFTPDWIVRYMVENSLGRLRLAGHPNEDLRAGWRYYMAEAEQTAEVAAQLRKMREEAAALSPEDIRCIDPCMGSGHILAYLFDVLMQIYAAHGYAAVDAVRHIVTKNLYGLDIDERAAQLAYFTVMMKARAYDRGFFRRGVQPNVHAIVESDVDTAYLYDAGAGIAEEEHRTALSDLVEIFRDAREYGALIRPPAHDYAALANVWEWAQVAAAPDVNMTLWSSGTNERIPQLIRQAQILSQRYHIVVTNPPYMGSKGMGEKLSAFVKKHYPDTKSDLFAAFIERCNALCAPNGYLGFLTPYVWMFISSYEKLRKYIIDEKTIITLIQFEYSAFEEATVPICTFVLQNAQVEKKSPYLRLTDYRGGMEVQRQKALEAIATHDKKMYFEAYARDFAKIPSSPIAYWVSEKFIAAYQEGCALGTFAEPKAGMSTGNNEIFERYWHEVSFPRIGFHYRDTAETTDKRYQWIPCNSGGEYRKWSFNNEVIVNWYNDGEAIRNYRNASGKIASAVRNTPYYFKEGLTWNKLSSSRFAVKYKAAGFAFDDTSRSIFLEDKDRHMLLYLLGLLCSNVTFSYLAALNPTMSFTNNDIERIPYLFRDSVAEEVRHLVEENIALSRADWDSYETSWDFVRHPLCTGTHTHISSAYEAYKEEANARFDRLRANEEELNRIFIAIYGLEDELTPEVAERDVTVTRIYDTAEEIPSAMRGSSYAVTRADVVRSLLSYAVGCMFGRYSLDEEGLVYAGGEWDATRYKTFIPDADAIIPVCDDEYFIDDIAARFTAFVEAAYGAETLEENLRYVADALGGKGAPREAIRSYFLREFYADHVRRYRRRPIYWLFDSGERNGFKALVYLHRYSPELLAGLRTDYIHPQQSRYMAARADVERRIAEAAGAERVLLTKRRTRLRAQEEELTDYEARVHHLADRRIALDLDDGVRHNYALLQDVLAKVK